MGGTTSKESPSGGSESRGGVQHVTTNTPAAESDLGKQDSTSTSKKMNAAARGHPATASETRQDLAGAGFLTAGAMWLRDNTVGGVGEHVAWHAAPGPSRSSSASRTGHILWGADLRAKCGSFHTGIEHCTVDAQCLWYQ